MAANILSGMVPLSLSFFLLFSLGSRADEAAVYDDLPSFMDIRIERLSGDARHLKDLLDQGKLGDFYQQALPVLNRELFDEDGGMTPEELENALFINNMVVKAPYQDYRLDNFSIWINGSELETKFKACCNLSKIQTYVRENKRLRQGKELARFCLEAEFEYIRRMMLQGAAVYRYIAGLEAEHGKFHPVRPVDTLPYWRYRETKTSPPAVRKRNGAGRPCTSGTWTSWSASGSPSAGILNTGRVHC